MKRDLEIAVVSTMEEARLPWLPHFVRHYQAQGAHRFFLTIQCQKGKGKEGETARKKAMALVRPLGVRDVYLLEQDFDAMALRRHHDVIQKTSGADWFVWADSDEFQIYPRPLPALIEAWHAKDIRACGGLFVDRITRSGELIRFEPRKSIWGQYPVGATVTRDLVRGQINKVVCSHASVGIKHANHDPVPGQRIKWAEERVPVHHFKWDKTMASRLRIRLTPEWRERCHWWVQTARLNRTLEENEGRIPLDFVTTFDFKDDLFADSPEPYRVNPRYREWSRSGRKRLWDEADA